MIEINKVEKFANKVLKGLGNLFTRSKVAVVTTIAVTGGILMANAFLQILPEGLSVFMTFILGLSMVIVAGIIGASNFQTKKRKR